MRIYIQTQGFELTAAIDQYVRRQLSSKLAGAEDSVVAVDVFLEDMNGPKGGIDKKALVCVQLVSRLAVRFEAVHDDLYRAIGVAARKTRQNVKRALRKHKRLNKAELREFRQYTGELQTG